MDSFCVGFVVSIGISSIDDTSVVNSEIDGLGDVISSCSKGNVVNVVSRRNGVDSGSVVDVRSKDEACVGVVDSGSLGDA